MNPEVIWQTPALTWITIITGKKQAFQKHNNKRSQTLFRGRRLALARRAHHLGTSRGGSKLKPAPWSRRPATWPNRRSRCPAPRACTAHPGCSLAAVLAPLRHRAPPLAVVPGDEQQLRKLITVNNDDSPFPNSWWKYVRQLCWNRPGQSGSVIDTVTKTRNLITVPMEYHGDDTPLSSYYWYMLANLMSMTLL